MTKSLEFNLKWQMSKWCHSQSLQKPTVWHLCSQYSFWHMMSKLLSCFIHSAGSNCDSTVLQVISAVPPMSCTQEAICRSNLKCHYSTQYVYRLFSRYFEENFLAIEMVHVTTPSPFSKSQSVWLQHDSRTEEATVRGNNAQWERIF